MCIKYDASAEKDLKFTTAAEYMSGSLDDELDHQSDPVEGENKNPDEEQQGKD